MKKFLASVVFLSLASIQLLAGTSPTSQFSVHARQIAAQSAAASATAKMHSARMHAFTAGNPPLDPVGFLTATQLPASGLAGTSALAGWSAVAADFNNDGKMDFAAPVETAPGVYGVAIVLNNGGGSFEATQVIANPNGVDGDQILVGDVNGDDNQDIIVVHSTAPATFEVWLGNGQGGFNTDNNTTHSIGGSNYPLAGVLWDLKGNGNLDLLFIDTASPASVYTITNNAGTFSPTSSSVTLPGGALSDVVFADFNGDGILDFAANDLNTGGETAVFLGQSNGTFVESTPLSNPNQAGGICNNAAGILNSAGNGNPDLVSVNCGGGVVPGSITVYVNSGNGTFPPGVVYYPATELTSKTDVSIGPLAVTIADVNGDGKNDIVSSNNYGGDVTILLGNGDGTLNIPTVGFATGGSPSTSALVADFNGDGFADIIVPDKEFSFVYLQGYGDGTFRAPMDYYSPVPDNLFGDAEVIATGDFNGDGYPDFVVGNCCDHAIGVTVFLSNPDGTLQPGKNLGVSGNFASVVVADFNQDGNLDFAAYDYSNNTIQVFLGDGKGDFNNAGGAYSTGGSNGTSGVNFNRMVSWDFNGDGYPDLAVVSYNSQNISVMLNDGTGAFPTAVTYADSGSGSAITTADVNGDGIYDLIVPTGSQGVDVFLGNANGTFQGAKTSTFAFNKLGNLAIGDLNGDGKLDIAVAVADTTTPHVGLAVAEGDGLGDFGTPVLYGITTQNPSLSLPAPGDVKMFDLKGNGQLDLVYTNLTYGTVGILYNTGTNAFAAGMFNSPVEYPAGSLSYSLALADVNHDGATDIVTSNNNYAGVTVLLNATGNSNTLVSSLNPSAVTQSVALTATVTATVRGVTATPTGTVTFMDGGTSLGASALNNGVASVKAAALAVGPHNITAQYSGDANFHATTSTTLSQLVILATDATALGSSLNPAGVGQSVTLSATVAASSTGVTVSPTGNVTFYDGGTKVGSVVVANGVARFVTSSLSAGVHSITAQYAGDTNFGASTSAVFSQSVGDFALAANNSSQTVNPGASAEYTISATPSYGYNANISFSCPATLPSQVTCTFSPASVSASGGKYSTTTLTLSTAGASTASLTPPVLPNSKPTDPMLLASLGGFGLFGLVFVGATSKRNRRHMAILGAALLITMFALVGCGGSSPSNNNNNSGGSGTPQGDYTITVTATGAGSGAPSHTMNVTLNVQ
jgi:Bacterial Ig-like domain (group 3)/FG-GAP-like repeat